MQTQIQNTVNPLRANSSSGVVSSSNDLLSPETYMGTLQLRVRDMKQMLSFYVNAVGLRPIEPVESEDGARGNRREAKVVLGLQGRPIVELVESPELNFAPARSAGLFHTAILFSSHADLAAAVLRVTRAYPHSFAGTGDHLVSEAFYYTDPEGNGVELYVDRPREQWQWVNGQVQMDTLFIDPNLFLQQHLNPAELTKEADGTLGHVHLQVGNIKTAKAFYVDILGFEQTSTLGNQALFVSAGGYHHHMAMNVWNSRGAGPRAKTLGMGVVDIKVPTSDDIVAAEERLQANGFATANDERTLTTLDPWNNEIRLSVAEA